MFASLHNGWEISKQSFRVVKLDKELLLFPLLSGVACLLVLASFAVPLWAAGQFQAVQNNPGQLQDSPLAWVVLFLFYFANYFVIVFFNSALIACAIIRFKGGDPTVGDGFRAAMARLPQIAGWALVSATVGLILRAIESRSERVGQFVAGLLGMAWSAATYFVVPVLVVERVGPVDAVKRSFAILKRTWGEALVANFGIGIIIFLAYLIAVVPAVLGVIAGNVVAAILGIAVTLVLWIVIALVSSALHAIAVGAIYLYAAEGTVPGYFDEDLLRDAFTQRRRGMRF
jgi:hypothetical protein